MIDFLIPPPLDLKRIGLHLPRPRSQRGELSEHMPKRGKLVRGRFWARWRVYARQADGTEVVKRAEKVIDRDVAEQLGLTLDYAGPLLTSVVMLGPYVVQTPPLRQDGI